MRPTPEVVRSLIDYDPLTGVFRWKKSRNGPGKVGDIAGGVEKGYWVINLLMRSYPAGVIAWVCVTGEWPTGLIDHRSRDSLDNRFANLREASHHQNNVNKANRNKTGHQGVRWSKKSNRWEANIFTNGKPRYLGSFHTKEDAGAAYRLAHVELHGEFSVFFNHEPVAATCAGS